MVIGVDEDNGVVGIDKKELPEWLNKVHGLFDGVYPSIQDITIPYNGKTVIALLFETDRAPYLIKVPEHGQIKGIPSHEVPWREGTEIRTAHRSDLIKILVPIIHDPEIELLDGEMILHEHQGIFTWGVNLQIYITPEMGTSFAIPFHRCLVSFEIPGKLPLTIMSSSRLVPPYKRVSGSTPYAQEPDSNTIIHTQDDALITGPGRLNISAKHEVSIENEKLTKDIRQNKLRVTIQILPTYFENRISFDAIMEPRENEPRDGPDCISAWRLSR